MGFVSGQNLAKLVIIHSQTSDDRSVLNGFIEVFNNLCILTQSSIHFKTSMALRDNRPGDDTTSLSLPSTQDNSRSHSQQPSNATTTSTDKDTVADHSPGLFSTTSGVTPSARSAIVTLSFPTPTQVGSALDIGEWKLSRHGWNQLSTCLTSSYVKPPNPYQHLQIHCR